MRLFFTLMLMGSFAWAIDSQKCSDLLNNGLYKKYKWAGIGEANTNAITAETKNTNASVASANTSTEGSTAIVDPKYTTNTSESHTQSTSSYGACSMFALQQRQEQRDLYVAQNMDQIRVDVANGQGRHLETLSWFSLCDNEAQKQFNQTLQNHLQELMTSEAKTFNKKIDRLIQKDHELNKKCYALSAI